MLRIFLYVCLSLALEFDKCHRGGHLAVIDNDITKREVTNNSIHNLEKISDVCSL